MSNWDIEEAVKTIENRSTELYTALEEHDYLLSGLVKLTENCDKEIFTVSKLRTVAKQEGNLGNISSLRREEVETYMDAITAVTEDEVKKIDNYTPYDPGFKINLEAENAAKIDAAVKGKDAEDYVEEWIENLQ